MSQGSGDLRFLRSLLGLKARFPERVHLVLGNRDINKMRLPAELSDRHWLAAADKGYGQNSVTIHFQPQLDCTMGSGRSVEWSIGFHGREFVAFFGPTGISV